MDTPIELGSPHVNLELLELFVAAADAGTFAAGARQLHMLPSVATRKVALLEDALHARLFDRTTRRIHLTEAGAIALEWAREVIAGREKLADELSTLQGELSGTLRLVVNEYFCTVLLPPFLSDFSQRHPKIRFSVSMTDTLVTPEKRDYDVAIHSGHMSNSSLIGVRIRSVKRVLCASPSYIARRGMPQRLEDLAMHDCLVHHQHVDGSWLFAHGENVVEQPIRQLVVANSYLPLMDFARKGMGIVRVSQAAVRDDLSAGRLVQILPEFENVYANRELPAIWVIYPDRRMLRRVRVFVDDLSRHLRQLD